MMNHELCMSCQFSARSCSGPCACLADDRRRDFLALAVAGECPKGYFADPQKMPARQPHKTLTAEQQREIEERRLSTFRSLWTEIHERPKGLVKYCGIDGPLCSERVAAEWAYLDHDLPARLPGCACGGDWTRLLAETPPDLTSPARYFDWTIAAHNAVNRRLGKPEMPLAEARQLHGWAG